jgi:hypothetical protein
VIFPFSALRGRRGREASDEGRGNSQSPHPNPEGSAVPITRLGPLEAYRFRAERTDDRARKTFVRLAGDSFVCDSRPIRRRDRTKAGYFERDWGRFLSGAIFEGEAFETRGTRGVSGEGLASSANHTLFVICG